MLILCVNMAPESHGRRPSEGRVAATGSKAAQVQPWTGQEAEGKEAGQEAEICRQHCCWLMTQPCASRRSSCHLSDFILQWSTLTAKLAGIRACRTPALLRMLLGNTIINNRQPTSVQHRIRVIMSAYRLLKALESIWLARRLHGVHVAHVSPAP